MFTFLLGINAKDLVLFIGVEAQVSVAADLTFLIFFATEDQPAVFGSLIIQEKHARRLAIGMRVLLTFEEYAGKQCFVGNNHAQRAVGFDDVDALHIDFFEICLISSRSQIHRES